MYAPLLDIVLTCPPAGGAAGKDQSVSGNRQPHFVRLHLSFPDGVDGRMEHIGKNGGLQAGGIGIDQEEEGIFGQELPAF